MIAPRRAAGWEQSLRLSAAVPSFDAVNLTTQHLQALKSPIYTSDEQQQRMFSSLQGPRGVSSMARTRAASSSAGPTEHRPQLAHPPAEERGADSVRGLDLPLRFLPPLRNFQPNASLPRALQMLSHLPWTNGNASQRGAPSPSPQTAAGLSRNWRRGNHSARRAEATPSANVKNLSFAQLASLYSTAAPKGKGSNSDNLEPLQIVSFLQDLPEDLLGGDTGQGQHAIFNPLQFQEARPDFGVNSTRTYINPGPPTHLMPDQPGPLIPLNETSEGNAPVRVQNSASVRAGGEASLRRPADISGWPADPLDTEGRPSSGSWGGQEAGTHGTEALTHTLRTEMASMGLSPLLQSPPTTPGRIQSA